MENRTVLVTGSARGIGKAIGQKFANNGFNVILNCIHNKEKMDELVLELQQSNKNAIGIQADVSNYAEAVEMSQKIHSVFGDVDILVNNAGISYIGLFHEMDPHQWHGVMNNNLISAFNCCHVFLPAMIRMKQGVIINISSVWGNVGASCEAVYAASKGGLNSFTKALAKELAPCNIRVNAISCGVIETEMNDFLSDSEKTELASEIPMGRFGQTHEIADTAYFLSSKEAAYLTGQIVTVDGGMC